jgi:hypothetical protein
MDVPDSYQDVAGIATHVPPSLTDRNATWQWMGVFLWNLNLFPSHPAVEYVGAVFQQILELPMYLRGEIPQSLHPLPDRPYYMAGRPVPVELLDQLVAAAEKLHDLAGPLQGESPTATSESSNHKLIVDLLRLVAIDSVSGETIELPSAQSARWLKVLADNEGVWISSSALKEHDAELDGVRTDRLLKLLPEGLAAKIQTSKQHGSRLLNS